MRKMNGEWKNEMKIKCGNGKDCIFVLLHGGVNWSVKWYFCKLFHLLCVCLFY